MSEKWVDKIKNRLTKSFGEKNGLTKIILTEK